jgi:putative endonuclease
MTNDLPRRLKEHLAGRASQFTKRYNITTLLYAEQHDTREKAAKRERQIKGWSRKKKLRLISSGKPQPRARPERAKRAEGPP